MSYSSEDDEGGFASDRSSESSEDSLTSLDRIPKRKTIDLRISSAYTKWNPRSAFRELVQNWRDAIIYNFQVPEADFDVEYVEKTNGRCTDIVLKAYNKNAVGPSREYLGYLWWKGKDGEGVVEISNRNAALTLENLNLGGTTKGETYDPWRATQAGAHGEGMKLALVVLLRRPQNHHVECASAGFGWTFNFSKRSNCLTVTLSRKSPELIQRAATRKVHSEVPYRSCPKADVTFTIGKKMRGVDNHANSTTRSPVTRAEFEHWITCAIFLRDSRHSSEDLVTTPHGDLLLGASWQRNVYLKGLLLFESKDGISASATGRPLKYGYNFAYGETNRERQWVASAGTESRSIAKIWESALVKKPELVEQLSAMMDHEDDYADVQGFNNYLNKDAVKSIQKYLTGEQFANRWYYEDKEAVENLRMHLTIKGFGRSARRLRKPYWDLLRKYRLLSTAAEEESQRFKAALPVTVLPDHGFAVPMIRLLRACILSCPQTAEFEVRFVLAGNFGLQVFLLGGKSPCLLIHERWLHPDQAAAELGLPEGLRGEILIYGTVMRLFKEAVWQVSLSSFSGGPMNDRDTRPTEWKRDATLSLASLRVQQYQHLSPFKASPCSKHSMSISVSWNIRDSEDSLADGTLQLECHRVSQCSHTRDPLLAKKALLEEAGRAAEGPASSNLQTECRVHNVSADLAIYSVRNLDPEDEYFFVLLLPSAPESIVHISDVVKASRVAAPGATSGSVVEPATRGSGQGTSGEVTMTGVNRSESYSEGDDSSLDVGIVWDNEDDLEITDDANSRGGTIAITQGNTRNRGRAPRRPDLITLGAPLQSLDILPSRRWHEARTDKGVNVVVGVPCEREGEGVSDSRKRRRVQDDSDDELYADADEE